ncbi:hypothetical protein L596_029480 [Steinernema carpocapsae]|uniref:Peptidase S1 domain-containing protein n=1 Tax=Steinernema carpocapsae TaxID=34508 RepID=A0A4U5LUS3_STECR|nr:hypothetical protein L596_029480 [Steinernema carpocapsae]
MSKLVVFLFTVSLLVLTEAFEFHPELFTIACPGRSPALSKVSGSENSKIQRICGYDDRAKSHQKYKISGGEIPPVGRFPWAVGIALPAEYEQRGQSICGGTIISPIHFISAAHCFFNYNTKSVPCSGSSVKHWILNADIHYAGTCSKQGKHCISANTRTTKIKKVHFTRKFHDQNCRSGQDFAIVEVEEFVFDDRAKPICIPKPFNGDADLDEYRVFTSYGFGKNEKEERSASLSYIDFVQSTGKKPAFFPLEIDKGIVEVKPDEYLKGICEGDSGSGLQGSRRKDARKFFLGIHSFGMPIGAPTYRSTRSSSARKPAFATFSC